MVNFTEHTLSNGLQVVIHSDHTMPIVCLNLLYKVGSRNEHPEKTGFAHLFEHLMFGGSKNIANFDEPLQRVGGENNAFTNTDITNYYISVPSNNVETAFWLESDRMLSLSFDPHVLEVQQKVVIEEFKQRYLNQPYGDLWLKLRPLAYRTHPYQWPTIGKEIRHIEDATMDDVKHFFRSFYHPANAILVIAGDLSEEKAMQLTDKWFGDIPGKHNGAAIIPEEPVQKESRFLEIRGEVPANALYKVFHMSSRADDRYHSQDLLSDVLGRGKSSILYQKLVKEDQLFSSLSCSVTGSYDPGLLVLSGKLNEGITIDLAEQAINRVIENFVSTSLDPYLVKKVKNQAESTLHFSEVDLLNRAMGLAYASFLGNTHLINTEIDLVRQVTDEDILCEAEALLKPENCSTVHYLQKR